MAKLKVAILEDNKDLLKELYENLKSTSFVEVVAHASNSEEFLQKVSQSCPEALILDIHLGGDSMNGLDIANHLKLPVLFVSGKTRDFYLNIEEYNLNSEIPVEHVSKPITIDKLNKILPKFIAEIDSFSKSKYVFLNFGEVHRNKIAINSIVYLCSDKLEGSESNNKQIFFSDRKPEMLIDFSFVKMEEKGFSKNVFIINHRSFRVNSSKIQNYNRSTHEIEVQVINSHGKSETKSLPVSENYRNDIKKYLR